MATKIYPLAIWQLRKYAADRTQQGWDDAFLASNADARANETSNRLGSELPPPALPWRIYRCVAKFSIPIDIGAITSTIIISKNVFCDQGNSTSGVMKDATTLGDTVADYGDMLDLPESTIVGSWYAPAVSGADIFWFATFNEAGCDFLISKAGGIAKIAFYSEDQPITPYERIWVNLYSDTNAFLLVNGLPGYIWVEVDNLAYIDAAYQKRVATGTLEGATGKTPGTHWVEGTKQRYIDSSGKERYIEGSLTGLTGKTSSQLSINTKSPMLGTHYCYIDSSGAERCFEGTAA